MACQKINILVYYAQEESVIIKVIVIILQEKPWNSFDYSPKGAAFFLRIIY